MNCSTVTLRLPGWNNPPASREEAAIILKGLSMGRYTNIIAEGLNSRWLVSRQCGQIYRRLCATVPKVILYPRTWTDNMPTLTGP